MYIYVPHIALLILVPVAVILVLKFLAVGQWITARAAGIEDVSLAALIGMRLRKVPPAQIVNPLIAAVKTGVDVNVHQLETHYLAGGSVKGVILALICAHRAHIPLSFQKAAALDLQGVNVLEVVQMSVQSNNIDARLR
ncbi:MAG: flotillin-like FloA family protein [Capsulimonas sp.]|uniref:flotillin-like FloA family protein n=1 Tax=Capsulimonas sp. TaxID=2494211 RepID=UPI00326347D8